MVRPADELPTESGSDAQATVPAKKGAVAGTTSVAETQPGSQKATQTMTPEGALLGDEIARTKLFLRVCAVLSAVLAICTPLLSGSREMRIAVFACCIGAMAAVLLFSRALRDERGYTTARWLLGRVLKQLGRTDTLEEHARALEAAGKREWAATLRR